MPDAAFQRQVQVGACIGVTCVVLLVSCQAVQAQGAVAANAGDGAPTAPEDDPRGAEVGAVEGAEGALGAATPRLDAALGLKVRRLRIAGWTAFSATPVLVLLGVYASSLGDMESDAWGRRLVAFETSAFLALAVGGSLLLRARLIVWRRDRSSLALTLSPGGLAARWRF